jgi:hypothetical protein
VELCKICGGWHRATFSKTYWQSNCSPFEFPNVEDIHPAYAAPGFMVTNEEHEAFAELLGDRTFKRGAAICSGGEMTLFLLLPRISDELIAVDHSYRALGATIVKIQLLLKLGAKACRDLFIKEDNDKELKALAEPIKEALPAPMKAALASADANYQTLFDMSHCNTLRPHWFYAKVEDLERSIANIRKLRLVHSDLRDIAPRGPFDLLYISNALDHPSRDTKTPKIDEFAQLVASKGYMLLTSSYYSAAALRMSTLELQGARKNMRQSSSSWNHCVYQKE